MGRLVRKPQVPDLDSQVAGLNGVQPGLPSTQTVKADPGDGYLERMVKYVPAEIIAFSMVINAILEQAMKSGGDHAAMAGVPVPVIAAVALVVACLLTPLFCCHALAPPKMRHMPVSIGFLACLTSREVAGEANGKHVERRLARAL